MSTERESTGDGERPDEAEVDAIVAEAEESFEQSRHRPPDLVGTRPEWDPATLVPTETPRAAAGRLWALAGESDTETLPADGAARAGTAEQSPADAAAAPTYSRYSPRFQFLLGALIAVGASAIVLLVAVVLGDGKKEDTIVLRSGPAWSKWQPAGSGLDAVEDIAKHVSSEYRLPSGKQMLIVTGGPLEFADFPATIALQQPEDQGGDIDLIDGSSVLYRMCGTNALTGSRSQDCTISGKPSESRMLLVRREALELALYSFRYIGVSQAVVLLPPTMLQPLAGQSKLTAKKSPPRALFFRRSDPDIQAALGQPLTSTLTPETPSVRGVTRSRDAQVVSALTASKLYFSTFSMANQDARAFLLLAPSLTP